MKNPFIQTIAASAALFCGGAFAITWSEVGDAGQTLASAQLIQGSGALTSISGVLASANDVDLFALTVPAGTPLVLDVASSSVIDSQLYVFDSTGRAIGGNDDRSPANLDAFVSLSLAAGNIYYVAITSSGMFPVNAANAAIFSANSPGLQTPVNGGGPLAAWSGSGGFGGGSYTVNLSGALPVPEPGTLALWAVGCGWLAWRARRQVVKRQTDQQEA